MKTYRITASSLIEAETKEEAIADFVMFLDENSFDVEEVED